MQCQTETVPICRKFVVRRPAPLEKSTDTQPNPGFFTSCFTFYDLARLTADLHTTKTPAPSVPHTLTGPITSAVTVAVIRRGTVVITGCVAVIGATRSGADERADSEAANDARCNRATIARFSRLRRGDDREPKGRSGRESS